MDTSFLLLARYNGLPIIPLHLVQQDFFYHLSLIKFLRKVNEKLIELPIVRIENSQKSAKGVHIEDLANYLDKRRAIAKRELDAFYK
jgi:hypothetical protein